ncbi:hypothetical protein ANO11243_077030 [Dothideomycetidae sp. 11243]|nr:hypothetical protein ANO11243_077030 [fungal sp. No.11243]
MQTSLAGWLKRTIAPGEDVTRITSLASPSVLSASAIPTPPPELDGENETANINETTNVISNSKVSTQVQSQENTSILHPNLLFSPITTSNIPHFKRINTLLLPIPYSASFYTEILSDPVTASLSLLAVWTDPTVPTGPKVIGGIRCRLLTPETQTQRSAALATSLVSQSRQTGDRILYISTLTLLSPYRSLGVATELLNRVVLVAREKYAVDAVGAHVWTANDEGRKWYARRGFEELQVLEGYYPRLKPPDAVVVMKRLTDGG